MDLRDQSHFTFSKISSHHSICPCRCRATSFPPSVALHLFSLASSHLLFHHVSCLKFTSSLRLPNTSLTSIPPTLSYFSLPTPISHLLFPFSHLQHSTWVEHSHASSSAPPTTSPLTRTTRSKAGSNTMAAPSAKKCIPKSPIYSHRNRRGRHIIPLVRRQCLGLSSLLT